MLQWRGRNHSYQKYSLAPTILVEEKLLVSKQYSLAPTGQVEEKLLIWSKKTLRQVYSLAPTKLRVEEKLLTMS